VTRRRRDREGVGAQNGPNPPLRRELDRYYLCQRATRRKEPTVFISAISRITVGFVGVVTA